MSIELERFYRPEEIDPDELDGMASEVVSRHRQILEFVDTDTHDTPGVNWDVYVQQDDRRSPIVGFAERTPRNRRLKTEKMWIEPFHVKDGWPFDADSDELELASNSRDVTISGAGIALAMSRLEDARLSLMVDAVFTMLNEKAFVYIDEADGKRIEIPYDEDIGDLTDPATALNDPNADVYTALFNMQAEFSEDQNVPPSVAFISSRTAATLLANKEIGLLFRAQQPSDPDKTGQTFQSFTVGTMTFVIFDKQYKTSAGLKSPIDYGRAIVMPEVLDEDGKSPIRLHKFATKLNRNQAGRAYYDLLQDSVDPPTASLALYDNMLPGVQKRGSVKHWKLWAA